jgi:serine/threonine protein kinase
MNESDQAKDPLFGNPASDLIRGALAGGAETASSQTSGRSEWQPPSATLLAEMLPAYDVQELIGRGGMGAVYRGVQLSLNRPVAIKLLPAELATSTEFVSRFQREAQTLARLQHPGIVSVYDFGRTQEGHLFFIMEFVNGTDLQHVIHGVPLEPDQALNLTLQICEALQYAHGQGVVHRDIKPANVLLTQDGCAKLADFGLARPLTATPGLTAASLVMGTPEYMAPEQWAGKVDHRADIYALGVMLYEMLTGSRPQGVFELPSEMSQVDARLDQVIVKAMRQAPEQRYQHVSELRDAVQRIRTTRPQPKPPQAPRAALQPRSPRRPPAMPSSTQRGGSVWGGLLVGLTIVALGYAAWRLMEKQPALPTYLPTPVPDAASHPENQVPVLNKETPKPAEPEARPIPLVASSTPPPAPIPTVQPSPTSSARAPEPRPVVIEVFSRESQNLIAWALAPLEDDTPPDIRQNLTFIREDLIDEGKTKPTASLDAYRAAFYLCEDLLTALNERDKARAAAGYRAAQATANQSTSTQALDARRNYLMSWPQYEREQSQRSALTQQNQARTAVATEAQKVAWTNTSTRLRTTLDTRYRAFRAALRQ